MLEIDGSYGEGGGQILRTSIALASVLRKPINVSRIRAGRPKPGLMAQHLAAVNAAAVICDAEISGAEVGSEELIFKPGKIRSGKFRFDVGTAGSVTLVLQAVMPILAFAPGVVDVEVTGGTDVRWSPPADYLALVVLPVLGRLGYHGRLELVRRGHYPRGGGLVRFRTEPSLGGLKGIVGSDRGIVASTSIISHSVRLPAHIASRQAEAASEVLRRSNLPHPAIRLETPTNGSYLGPGSGVVVVAETIENSRLGGDILGDRGVAAEKVGAEAASILVEDLSSRTFLDRHMADIIIPYATLAYGRTEVTIARVTEHVRTNIRVAEWLTGASSLLEGEPDKPGKISIEGLGYS